MDRISKSLEIYEEQWKKEGKSFKKPVFEIKKPDTRKIDYSFQELGLEMQEYFGKGKKGLVWSLFYKYSEQKIYEAYKICRERKIKEIKYLLGIIKNLN